MFATNLAQSKSMLINKAWAPTTPSKNKAKLRADFDNKCNPIIIDAYKWSLGSYYYIKI